MCIARIAQTRVNRRYKPTHQSAFYRKSPHLSQIGGLFQRCPTNHGAQYVREQLLHAYSPKPFSCGIKIQSNILILILKRILILTENLQNDITFGRYLSYIKHNFLSLNFMVELWKKKIYWTKNLRPKTKFHEYL